MMCYIYIFISYFNVLHVYESAEILDNSELRQIIHNKFDILNIHPTKRPRYTVWLFDSITCETIYTGVSK